MGIAFLDANEQGGETNECPIHKVRAEEYIELTVGKKQICLEARKQVTTQDN